MKSLFNVLFLLLPTVLLVSCASNETITDVGSNPVGDIEEGFMTQEPRTFREDKYKPNEFFFKHCDQQFSESFYSKTAYFCNER